MIDDYLNSFDKYDNIVIRIRMRVPRRFETEYPEIIQSIKDFAIGQFFGWQPPEKSSPFVVTIKPDEEETKP